MKYVLIPDDIQLLVNGQPELDANGKVDSWSISRYLETVVLADPGIGTDYKSLKACFAVDEAFLKAVPGKYVEVDYDHWEKLKETIENPKGGGISPSILRQFLPFMDAIIEAKDTKPEEVKHGTS